MRVWHECLLRCLPLISPVIARDTEDIAEKIKLFLEEAPQLLAALAEARVDTPLPRLRALVQRAQGVLEQAAVLHDLLRQWQETQKQTLAKISSILDRST